MARRTWVAIMNCQMPFKDFVKGEEIELDDSQVTSRVKALFKCRGEKEEEVKDPDMSVMILRLKAAKIPLPRKVTKEKVKELFDTFLAKGSLAQNIAGDAGETDNSESSTEDKPKEDAEDAPSAEASDDVDNTNKDE